MVILSPKHLLCYLSSLAIAVVAATITLVSQAPRALADDIALSFDLTSQTSSHAIAPPSGQPRDSHRTLAPSLPVASELSSPSRHNPAPVEATKLDPETRLAQAEAVSLPPAEPIPLPVAGSVAGSQPVHIPADWWEQGSDSPLAIAIGAAEGTRTPNGDRTAAYYWHTDPGNGANNFGTFSYQHLSPQETRAVDAQPSTVKKRQVAAAQDLPEEADKRQLQKLRNIHDTLQAQAAEEGVTLSTLELVNGLDLANQSEAAALSQAGYIDRLAQMKQLTPDPDEQIAEARTWSYWHPQRDRWDAPGLGNTYDSIRRDQERRADAVKDALVESKVALATPGNTPNSEAIANQIIFYNR